jgi:hypothetical protein
MDRKQNERSHGNDDAARKSKVEKLTQRLDHLVPDPGPIGGRPVA